MEGTSPTTKTFSKDDETDYEESCETDDSRLNWRRSIDD
jgi:hypothetical protein